MGPSEGRSTDAWGRGFRGQRGAWLATREGADGTVSPKTFGGGTHREALWPEGPVWGPEGLRGEHGLVRGVLCVSGSGRQSWETSGRLWSQAEVFREEPERSVS